MDPLKTAEGTGGAPTCFYINTCRKIPKILSLNVCFTADSETIGGRPTTSQYRSVTDQQPIINYNGYYPRPQIINDDGYPQARINYDPFPQPGYTGSQNGLECNFGCSRMMRPVCGMDVQGRAKTYANQGRNSPIIAWTRFLTGQATN
jgi:hypothetical protein